MHVVLVIFVLVVLLSPVRHAGMVWLGGLSLGFGFLCILSPDTAPFAFPLLAVGVFCVVALVVMQACGDVHTTSRRSR